MTMSWRVLALAALLSCVTGRLAWADDAAAAREHAQKATTFYQLAKYDDAIREFEAAYEAKADPALLYNIAQCHRLAGRDSEALRLYRNYVRQAPRGPYRSQAEQWIATLEKAAADHPAPAPAPPPTVDTAPATVPNAPPPANPGPGPVGPAAPGPAPPGEPPAEPSLGLPPPPDTTPQQPLPPPPAPPATSAGHRKAAVVVASIGGAFVIGGAVCGLIAKAEAKKVEDAAANHEAFDPSVEKAGRNAQTAQWIGYGIGVAGLAVGVILFATSPSSSSSSETAPANRVALAPLAGPGLGGALMRVAF